MWQRFKKYKLPEAFKYTEVEGGYSATYNLFDYVKNDKQEKLDQALDSIRQKYGSKAVMRGSFLEEKRPPKATPYD